MSDAGADRMPPLEARGLLKRYGPIVAVDGVDLTVHAGDVYGFLGPNGAGKTTAMRILLGLLRPDGGDSRLFGRDPAARAAGGARRRRRVRRDAALLSVPDRAQEPRAARGLRRRRRGAGAIDELLELVELREPRRATGSAATRRGCGSGSASPPRSCATRSCSILDEPTNGLDPGGIRDMRDLIKRARRTRDDHLPLQPSAGRGRGALHARRDHPLAAGSSTRARSPTSTRAPTPRYRLRTTDHELLRRRSAPRTTRVRDLAVETAISSVQPPTSLPSSSSRAGSSRRASGSPRSSPRRRRSSTCSSS